MSNKGIDMYSFVLEGMMKGVGGVSGGHDEGGGVVIFICSFLVGKFWLDDPLCHPVTASKNVRHTLPRAPWLNWYHAQSSLSTRVVDDTVYIGTPR